MLEPIPAIIGQQAKYILDQLEVHHRNDIEIDKHSHSHRRATEGSWSTQRERTQTEHTNSTQRCTH